MINAKHLLARLLFAACLIGSTGLSAAGPYYHVNVDTSSLGSGPAYLGLSFLALGGAGEASATVTRLTGAVVGPAMLDGSVTGTVPGPVMFSNSNGGGDLVQAITLGGLFSFDVSFALGGGDSGTTFGWALFNDVDYLGVQGDLGDIFLQPDAAPDQRVRFTTASALSQVAVVPEPSSVMLMLLAGMALVVCLRRKA